MNACSWTDAIRRDPRGPILREEGPKNAGPLGWKVLHLAALDGKLTQQFAQDFAGCVNCPDCKRHFQQMIRDMPVTSSRPADAFPLTIAWHNRVNAKTHKPQMTISEAMRIWNNVRTVAVGMAAPGVPQMSQVVVR